MVAPISEQSNEDSQFQDVQSNEKNITSAVNYEVSMVNQFMGTDTRKKRSSSNVENIPECTASQSSSLCASQPNSRSSRTTENIAPNSFPPADIGSKNVDPLSPPPSSRTRAGGLVLSSTDDLQTPLKSSSLKPLDGNQNSRSSKGTQQRRSTRERSKREQPMARSRVRYDMQMVPVIKRNSSFLERFPMWWMPAPQRSLSPPPLPSPPSKQAVAPTVGPPRRSSRLNGLNQKEDTETSTVGACDPAKEDTEVVPSPFQNGESVIWIPSKRTEWEDSIDEMTALCATAAIRRNITPARHNTSKPFHAPLSREYIRDRVDIDDPLHGYQIRHRTGGWLQGFILWTNFTTWTHYFKWDSRHPKSGLNNQFTANTSSDFDGTLADELEKQPRSGDPSSTGIVFPGLAEIALVGGLGCGEYLLRMALESIRDKKQYKFVVLQATDQSKTFYERFGFVRVGAVCRYGASGSNEADCSDGRDPTSVDGPLMGYRHWTHANESQSSLQMHGGPSYMMCLRLPDPELDPEPALSEIETNSDSGGPIKKEKPRSFLEEMLKLVVDQKPTVEQLGTTTVPAHKISRRSGSLRPSTGAPSASDGAPSKREAIRKSSGAHAPRSSAMTSSKKKAGHLSSELPLSDPNIAMVSSAPSAAKSTTTTEAPVNKRPMCENADVAKDEEAQPSVSKRRRIKAPKVGNETESGDESSISQVEDSVTQEAPALRSEPPANELINTVTKEPVSANPSQPEPNEVVVSNKTVSNDTEATESESSDDQLKSPKKDPTPPDIIPSKAPLEKALLENFQMENPRASLQRIGNRKPVPIVRNNLLKQKVKSYPRSRVHYFNRVVKPKQGPARYYFVLNYDEQHGIIRIVPMVSKGRLSGKREGRPRFQAMIGETDSNFETVLASDYKVVAAVMVMKTPIVASEAWDIEDFQE